MASSGLEAVPTAEAHRAGPRDWDRVVPDPTAFAGRSWRRIVWRTLYGASDTSFGVIAGGCAFYGMLALFPGLAVFVSLYGLGADPLLAERHLQALQPLLPREAYTLVANRAHELVTAPYAALNWRLALGLAIALYSASAGSRALLAALNIAYYEQEKRSILRFNGVALLFTVGLIFGTIVALAVVVAVPVLLATLPLGPLGAVLLPIATYSFFALVVLASLALLYRYGPSRRQARWRWVTPGSGAAAIFLVLTSGLFSLYVRYSGSYDATYGSIGAVVVVLFWLYLSCYVILAGARLNAELELETAHDTTVGSPKPPGRRGAYVADNVAS